MANFNIASLIELKDRYSRIAEKVSKNNKFMQNTFERLKNSVSSINNVLDKAKAKLSAFGSGAKNIGESISGVGRNLAGATVAISGLFWKSLRSWEAQASAISTLEQALKTRQASLGMTSKELQDMASEMQKKSIFGDEGIIQNVTNQLLTFDKVNGDVFKRASQSVIDMTSKLYGANATVEQSRMLSLALGKALNTPAEAMNSLGRVGIRFNKDQQQIVKYLVQTGQTAKAQSYILKQLEDRYGGAAEALAKTQPLKVLANAFDDMLEPLGQIVQEFLVPLVKIGKCTEADKILPNPIKGDKSLSNSILAPLLKNWILNLGYKSNLADFNLAALASIIAFRNDDAISNNFLLSISFPFVRISLKRHDVFVKASMSFPIRTAQLYG